jgi:hypothetical protein
MVILFSLPVALSFAPTCKMPLASISKLTSICGVPRDDGGMPSRLNSPSSLLCGHFAFALEHLDGHGALVVVGRRKV